MKKITAMIITVLTALSAPAYADALDEMLETDRAFAAMAQKEGVPAAFAAYAEDGVFMFPEGGDAYTGRKNMIARFAQWPEAGTIEWTPMAGVAGDAGDFGFTWGNAVITIPNGDGEKSVSYSKYLTVWRQQADGSWKFVADMGNARPAPEGE